MPSTRGRQVVIPLTNKSGGSVAAGDVVVIDTTTNESFTTTTTGRAELSVGIAQDTIANNAIGRVLLAGYAALVNVPASVTRGHYIETHTVAKQATGNSTRRSGSLGQFLTTSATPTAWLWGQTDQTASGGSAGALILLQTQTASASATLDFTTFISSTYDDYLFRFIGIVPATNAVDFYMRMSTGAVFDSGTNYVNNHYLQATSGNVSATGTADTAIAVRRNAEITNATADGLAGQLDLFAPQSTALVKRVGGSIRWNTTAGAYVNSIMDGQWKTSGSAVDGVRFLFSSGNIASGTIRVYGVAKT